MAKQGRPAFVCASAPLVAKSSLKTRHKEAAEEPDKPPPISSPSCHDSPRLSGQPCRGTRPEARAAAAKRPFVCLIIQITTWGEIRAGPDNTDYVLSCSCSSPSLQGVSIPRRMHVECGRQQLYRLPGTPLCRTAAPQHLMQECCSLQLCLHCRLRHCSSLQPWPWSGSRQACILSTLINFDEADVEVCARCRFKKMRWHSCKWHARSEIHLL